MNRRETITTGVYAAQGGGLAAMGTLAGIWYGRLVLEPGQVANGEIAAVSAASVWLMSVVVKSIRDWWHSRKLRNV